MKMTMVKSGLKGLITIVASINHMVNTGQNQGRFEAPFDTPHLIIFIRKVMFCLLCLVLFCFCYVLLVCLSVSVRPYNYGTDERICMKFFSEACRGPRTNPLNLGDYPDYDPDPASRLRSLISVEVSSLWLTVLYLIKYGHFFVHIHTSG